MRVYAVFEPPAQGADAGAGRLKHAERFRFVYDGFSWPAFVFTPLWMLRYRLWAAFALYAVVVAGLGWGELRGHVPRGTETVATLLLGFLIGLEGATLRRRKLLHWGWRDVGIVVADNLRSAEQRFFDRWVTPSPSSTPDNSAAKPTAPPAYDSDSYVIGMLASPGGRS